MALSRGVLYGLALAPMLFPQLKFAPVKILYDQLVKTLVVHGYAKDLAASMEKWVQNLVPRSITCHIYTGTSAGIRKGQCVLGGPLDGAVLVGTNVVKIRLAAGVRAVLPLPVTAQGRRVVTRRGATDVPGFPGWTFLGARFPGCVPVMGVCA